MSNRVGRGVLSAFALAVALAGPARATTINILPISSDPGHIGDGTPQSQLALAAMQRAADNWESILMDSIIINLRVDFSVLGNSILATASPSIVTTTYSSFLATVGSEILPGYTLPTNLSLDLPSGITWNNSISMTTANAKALGFTGGPLDAPCNPAVDPGPGTPSCDGTMRFNSNFNWDFDSSNGITPGYFDLEGVAMHEIGHALGFFSEVDTIDYMIYTSTQGPTEISVLDLYRFADCQTGGGFGGFGGGCPVDEPETLSEFTTATRYLGTDAAAVFSLIDRRWALSQGAYTGDFNQASHWAEINPRIGILDPRSASGELLQISNADITAMNALGYNITQTPEPSSVLLTSAGCVALLILVRRRRSAA